MPTDRRPPLPGFLPALESLRAYATSIHTYWFGTKAEAREIAAAFDELQNVREAAEKLVGAIYGLSVNSDADYDEALGSLRQALAGVSGAD